METRRIKYRILPTSSAPMVTFVLSLAAAALVGVVYWPVFAKYAGSPASADYTLTAMTWAYGILLAAYLLFALSTLALGKKTMVLSALFAAPICVFYAVEKSGPLYAILYPELKGLAGVYASNPDYFSGRNLTYVIAASAFALLALVCFWSIVFNGGRSRTFAMFVIVVATAARVLFALYDVRSNYQPLMDKGELTGTAYIYQILLQVAAVLFFITLTVLAIELRRHFDEEPAPAATEPALAVPAAPAATEPAPTVPAAPAATGAAEGAGKDPEGWIVDMPASAAEQPKAEAKPKRAARAKKPAGKAKTAPTAQTGGEKPE